MATIRKRGNSYQIRVSVGYDINGNHKEQSMTWKPPEGMTERQIQKELNRQVVMFEEACANGCRTTAMKSQELAEEWMVNYAQFNLRHTTYEHIMQSTKRVYPAIGHLRVDKISSRQLQSFVNSMAKDGVNEHTGQPLARRTIARHLSFISSVLGYAVRAGMIPDNPCSKVTLPKGTAKEKEIYSQEEMQQLLDMLADQPLKYCVFFHLIAYSGFRLSEMLGLE